MDQHLEDLAHELSGQRKMTYDELQDWIKLCTDEQLDALIERLSPLSKEEYARTTLNRDGATWRVEFDGRVILSSDKELPAYVPGRRAPQAPA